MSVSRLMSSAALATAFVAGAFVAIALSSTVANATSLILDGNFNGTPPTVGQQYYITHGSSIDGDWKVLDNNVDVVAPGLTPYGMVTPSGLCCSVDLVGNGSTGGIYQSFTTTAAGTYRLSFYYANNFYSTSSAAANVEVGSGAVGGSNDLLLNNVNHSTSLGASALAMHWTLFSQTFLIPTAEIVTLSFDTTSGANSGGVMITDVSVSQTPLPSTWLMLLSGFFGLGFFAYRGMKKNSAALAAA